MRILILGGTAEARELAAALRDDDVTLSLAKHGGFGGVDGLRRAARAFDVVVDATHPFATRISDAAAQVGAIRLERPGFEPHPGDVWVGSIEQAAAATAGRRVLITIGHRGLEHFTDGWFLVRAITPPATRHTVVLARGPFTLDGERELLERYAIEALVTKDSGGPAPKLQAARERGIPVVIVRRPRPTTPTTVEDVLSAIAARRARTGHGRRGDRQTRRR